MINIIHLILTTTLILGSAPSPTAISGQGQSPWFESNAPSAGTVPLCHLDYHPYGDTKTEEGSLAVSRKFTGNSASYEHLKFLRAKILAYSWGFAEEIDEFRGHNT